MKNINTIDNRESSDDHSQWPGFKMDNVLGLSSSTKKKKKKKKKKSRALVG